MLTYPDVHLGRPMHQDVNFVVPELGLRLTVGGHSQFVSGGSIDYTAEV